MPEDMKGDRDIVTMPEEMKGDREIIAASSSCASATERNMLAFYAG